MNPFSLPTHPLAPEARAGGVAAGQATSARRSSGVSRHLVCELPDIYLVPPAVKARGRSASVCLWDSQLDGKVSTFLDSNPGTPVSPLDYLALAASSFAHYHDGHRRQTRWLGETGCL